MTRQERVIDALAEVYDPELDEPITRLGFVASCEVSTGGDVEVVLRLPTPQCAPNFAFLMAADARQVVRRLPEVREVTIKLEDHYTGAEINAALGRGEGFTGAFPGETVDDDLNALRELFLRKALVGRQSRLCEALLARGESPEQITARRLEDLPDLPDARRCLELRRRLGLPARSGLAGVRAPKRRAGGGRRAEALAAHGAARPHEPRGERRHLPLASAIPPRRGNRRSGGGPDMKAARLHAYHEALKLEEVDEPKIVGPLDVIVRIGAAGLCRTDLHIQEGQWAEKSQVVLPYTPGHENAGWVHEVGSAVTNVEVGDTVIVHPFITCGLCSACRRGDDMHCVNGSFPGINRDGGFADFLQTSARSVVKLAPGLEPKDIAALADAGLTAIHAVKKAIPVLEPGTTAVVIGAGGLGHIGIQCLKAMTSATVIVVDPSEKALALAGEMGADQTVKVDGSKHVDTVKEMTDGFGAEAIIDFVGERGAIEDGIAMVRDGGFYYVIGYGENIDIPTIDVISREISFIGNLVGTYTDLEELMTLTAQGQVTLHTSTYPLDAINDAMADLDGGRLQGRGILIPAGG